MMQLLVFSLFLFVNLSYFDKNDSCFKISCVPYLYSNIIKTIDIWLDQYRGIERGKQVKSLRMGHISVL